VQWRGYFIAAQALMPDQRIVFGGLLGATVFDPIKVGDDSLPRPARITAARAVTGARARGAPPASAWQLGGDGTPELQLAPATDALALEFSALHFGAPRRVEYSYRLAGFDPDWIAADSEHRIAMFTGLPPGTFHFQVRARAQGGDWSEPAELAVRHLPSFWQTLWARTALALGGLVAFTTVAWQGRARLRERRGSERRLRQSEERLKLALWGSGDELWDMNLETRELRRANPLNHVDIPQGEYVADSATLRSSAHPEDMAVFDRAFADLMAARSEYLDVVYRVRDQQGRWRWLRSRGRIVQHSTEGTPRRMVGTTEDISELKEHEQALERINQDLERRVRDRTGDLTLANEQLTRTVEELRQAQRQLVDAEKMAALGGLVAGIAHEINTPLGISVTAASHLESEVRRITELLANHALKRSDLDLYQQTALESAQMILRNLQRADKLVKGFKQVAVDQSSEQRRTINLAEYLDEILTSLHPALKKTQHRVLVDCPSGIELDTYPGALYQIMVNLAMNSLLHGFDGIDEGSIRIRASVDGDSWELDYRDDGRGMTEAVRRRIFEPFFTTKRGRGGSGLGLHIVFNLVHQVLLGTLRCESEPGKGARFILKCPVSLK
jgi:signal transduction histidine kinase